MGKPNGDNQVFESGAKVRYKPGAGTYGYEDAVQADGRIPALVIEPTRARVRVEFILPGHRLNRHVRAVDAASLVAHDDALPWPGPLGVGRG